LKKLSFDNFLNKIETVVEDILWKAKDTRNIKDYDSVSTVEDEVNKLKNIEEDFEDEDYDLGFEDYLDDNEGEIIEADFSPIKKEKEYEEKIVETDWRGRVCVPASFLRKIHAKPGDAVFITIENNWSDINKKMLTIGLDKPKDSIKYIVDKDNNVRIASLRLKQAGLFTQSGLPPDKVKIVVMVCGELIDVMCA
jgi:hypothetical protein